MLQTRKNDLYFDQLFDNFFTNRNTNNSLFMNTNIKETKETFILSILIPGIKKDEIELNLKDEYLTVTINPSKEDRNNIIYKEYSLNKLSRSYYVGNIENTDIKAKLDNGILTLIVNKPIEKPLNNFNITIE